MQKACFLGPTTELILICTSLFLAETNTKVESEKDDSNWEIYLGSKEDPISSIMIRFPDGNRVTKEIPCSSQFLVSFLINISSPKVRFKHQVSY